MEDMQKLVAALNEGMRGERSRYHLTLGQAIERLEAIADKTRLVIASHHDSIHKYVSRPHSYRGYYSDLSLEPSAEPSTVGEVLDMLHDALGREFMGYKGGEYLMNADTPLWFSAYGYSSDHAIVDMLDLSDRVMFAIKNVED